MSKYLLIVESPNKIEKISSLLNKDYKVIASYGHIQKISDKGEFNLGISLSNGFKINYELLSGKVQVFQNILNEIDKHDTILLAGDDDREGTAICYSIYERIKAYADSKTIKRISFNKIEKKCIEDSIKNATDIDMNVVHSQMARSAIDKICGYMVSPYLAKTFGIKNISAGRVQSIIVKLINERENEILNFKPEDYWTFQIPLSFNSINFAAKYENRITSQKQADDLLAHLVDKNTVFTTTKVTAKAEKFNPQPPFDTNNMIAYMGKRYKWDPDKTLGVAQKLFEGAHISYHRSDSVSSSPDEIKNLISYIKTQNLPLPSKQYAYKDKQGVQGAHTAIHPLDLNTTKVFGGVDENLLYSVIRQQFICSQLKYATYNTLKVSIDVVNGKKKETLVCSGKSLKDPGFLTFLNVQDNSKINIPDLKKGDVCLLQSNPIVEKKHTNPKSRLSIATLISNLKDKRVGRPSTISSILKKVLDKKYIELRDGIYHPLETGVNIVNEIDNKFDFMSYTYTAEIEKSLDLIAENKATYFDTVNNFYNKFKSQLDSLYKIKGFDICKKCGGVIVERLSKDSKSFFGCSNFPNCKNIILNVKQ